ncbi:MAG: ROK family protein [Gaiellaceae bacterium]
MPISAGARTVVAADGASPPAPEVALGLDIGGTKLAAGVVDASGSVHSFAVEPSLGEEGPEAVLARLLDLGSRAVAESGVPWAEIASVGIGCGGPIDDVRGVVLSPPHLPGWVDVPVTALAQDAYGRQAVLENDATAAAAAEHRYGAGRGTRNMVYLTISTGVGGGIVIDGRLYRGSLGNGGEFGHVTIDCAGRPCHGCGRLGCLEAYVSGTSIAQRAREALADGRESALPAEPTAADVAAAAQAGDPLAREIWDEATTALGCGLTSIVNVLEPELVVLGGGVTRSGDLLLEPVREAVRTTAMSPAGRAAGIVLSGLGDRVGVVGAAAIAFERVGASPPAA